MMKRSRKQSIQQAIANRLIRFEARACGFTVHYVDLGDMRMSYLSNFTEPDERPVIVLLHGMSADKSVWPRFARHLSKDYRVLIPDLPGHADTGYIESWNYSAPNFAKSIKRFLDHLAITQVHVVGNSLGGFVAAYFALDYPGSTLSATLIDATGVSGAEPSDMDKLVEQDKVPFFVSSRTEFDHFWKMTMAQPPWFPSILLGVLCERYMARRSELKHIFADYNGKNFIEHRLAEISVPVLQLWGAKDQLVSASCADVWATGVPSIETIVWPDIGHMPMLEIPRECSHAVMQFIASRSSST